MQILSGWNPLFFFLKLLVDSKCTTLRGDYVLQMFDLAHLADQLSLLHSLEHWWLRCWDLKLRDEFEVKFPWSHFCGISLFCSGPGWNGWLLAKIISSHCCISANKNVFILLCCLPFSHTWYFLCLACIFA